MYEDTVIINDDLRSHRVLLLDNHLSKLSSEQKAEAAKKIVVNILPVDFTSIRQEHSSRATRAGSISIA